MKKIQWNETELEIIAKHGEVCAAVAQQAMERSGVNFDDIERINNHFEVHTWGSNADRKYRKAAVNKAILKVAMNPMQF